MISAMGLRLFFITLLLLFCVPGRGLALEVQDVRIGLHSDKTRIVVDVDQLTDFRVFTLQGPDRVVIDLPSFAWQASLLIKQEKGSVIAAVRHGNISSDTSRIVFDVEGKMTIINAFALPAAQGKPDRIVIDVRPYQTGDTVQAYGDLAETGLQESTVPAAAPPVAPPPPPQKQKPARKLVIVIDPGHGGQDPGATSGRTHEKHIVLALGKALKAELESMGKYEVHMTRSSDRFIKLHDRVKFARSKNADLFVSIHADSIPKSSVRGASIYTLSEKASDAQTAKLAARENKADLISGIDLSHEDHDVAGILLDLVQRDTMNQSNFFAEKLVAAFKREGIRILDNPHRSAGFAVLKAPDIPSILIEAGFVSNRHDARLLTQASYQKKVAGTIARGIDAYLSHAYKN